MRISRTIDFNKLADSSSKADNAIKVLIKKSENIPILLIQHFKK